MEETFQTEGLNLYQHGQQVWHYYNKILEHDYEGMKIPKWYLNHSDFIHQNLYPRDMIETYAIWHDIGKTETLQIGEDGRRRFPGHAEASRRIWLSIDGDTEIAELMGLDMIFHTESAEQILERGLSNKMLCTLMLSALSELHANAEMFGGIQSESFCIKYKKLEQRAKKILATLTL